MSADFALLLKMPTTQLLVAVDDAWQLVGEAALDSDDMAAALSALREKGEAVAGGAVSWLLVLPDDQIKYLAVPAEGDEAAAAIAALDGATPYAVRDLAYDWTRAADTLHVAAVARETLAEAEGFVQEHGFTPAGFIAAPAASDFPVRPVFDSPTLARGAPHLPIGGAFTPKPPPAFASRRAAPPLAPPTPLASAIAPIAPRISLSATHADTAAAPVGTAAPPAPKPSPPVTGKSAATLPPKAAPAPPEPDLDTADMPAKAQIGGKPRYLGLILTLALLALLAAVALWSMTLGEV